MDTDFVVVGAGIVGLATALALLRHPPGSGVVVLEKESGPGLHQTGHNSGVIHSGVYYEPGSYRARLCREGTRATRDFCAEHGVKGHLAGQAGRRHRRAGPAASR